MSSDGTERLHVFQEDEVMAGLCLSTLMTNALQIFLHIAFEIERKWSKTS